MEKNVVIKESFYVLGIEGEGLSSEGFKWVPPLWKEAAHFESIKDLAKVNDGSYSVWGAMSDPEMNYLPWNERGRYLAGCEVEPLEHVPKGWTLWQIPSFKYLAVPCTQRTYGETFNEILNVYFKEHHYELAGAVHEYYEPNGDMLLYFPIEKL